MLAVSDTFDRAFQMGVNETHKIVVRIPDGDFVFMRGFDDKNYRVRDLSFTVGKDSVWITGWPALAKGGYSKTLTKDQIGSLSDVPAEVLVALALRFLRA